MAPAVLESRPDLSSPTLPGTAYRNFVNPEWARLLSLLGMDIKYRRCLGTELHTEDGRIILDFLSGYCVHNILSQMCGNNFMVLKVAPPLVITEDQTAQYLDAIEAVMETVHSSSSFWSDALRLAQRAVRV
jgi:4-aminobutyrate aminotransferase-like enzyme